MIKTCYICGKTYHVSAYNSAKIYICPVCDSEWKREQRKVLDTKHKKKKAH